MTSRYIVVGLVASVLLSFVMDLKASDWPCFRGPNNDGRTTERVVSWPPLPIWSTQVGEGFSEVVVSKGRVYTLGWANGTDTVYCFDQASPGPTPTLVWKSSYACAAGFTESTPTADGDQVYTFSRDGQLICFDAATGTTNWVAIATNGPQGYGFASSPFVEGNNVIVNAGSSGIAIDKSSGQTSWISSGMASYASPFEVTIDSQRTVVMYGGNSVSGVDPTSGNVLWYYPMPYAGVLNPIVFNKELWVSASDPMGGSPVGSVLVNITGSGLLTNVVWKNSDIANQYNCWVYYNGYMYGIGTIAGSSGIICMDASTGAKVWNSADSGAAYACYAGLTLANDHLIAVNDAWTNNDSLWLGDIVVVPATPLGYGETYRADGVVSNANPDSCWIAPVLSNGRIYVRTLDGTLACLSVGSSGNPPVLTIAPQLGNQVQLSWPSDSGTTYGVYKTTNLLSGWPQQPCTNLVGSGSSILFSEPIGSQNLAFYRIKATQ